MTGIVREFLEEQLLFVWILKRRSDPGGDGFTNQIILFFVFFNQTIFQDLRSLILCLKFHISLVDSVIL